MRRQLRSSASQDQSGTRVTEGEEQVYEADRGQEEDECGRHEDDEIADVPR